MLETYERGDIIIGDSFYGTYFLLASIIEKQVVVLFEQQGARKRIADFRKGKRLGNKDHLIEIPKPKIKPDWMTQSYYEQVHETVTIRELSKGEKCLITSILQPAEALNSELKTLYKLRWQVELKFRHIKTTLGMDISEVQDSGDDSEKKWVYFLAYNPIRLMMAQSSFLVNTLPRELSFKHA